MSTCKILFLFQASRFPFIYIVYMKMPYDKILGLDFKQIVYVWTIYVCREDAKCVLPRPALIKLVVNIQ